MSKSFELAIYASDHVFYQGTCDSLIVPMEDGLYGIKAGHHNAVCALVPGSLSFRLPSEDHFRLAVVSTGILKIEENSVLVLVNSCEDPAEIDLQRADRAKSRAQAELRQKASRRDHLRAQISLAKAMARLQAGRRKHR